MVSFFTQTQQGVIAALFFVIGAIVGRLANLWSLALTRPSVTDSTSRDDAVSGDSKSNSADDQLVAEGRPITLPWGLIEITTGLLFAGFVTAYLRFHCQELAEVRPDDFWLYGRIIYQSILISLLVAATATDLRDYVIPDQITFPGALLGVAGATLAGQLQMVHVWVDWNQEIPGIAGPYIPDWLDAHRHLHGLAWSLAGGLCGASITWIVRACSFRILGREALGLGDVTLMGMIGCFLGWQPTIFVFLVAPLCGLAAILPLRLFSRRSYVPYGPFLAAGTVIVLCAWRRLWISSRLVFGDARSIAVLASGAMVAFVVLLFLLRARGNPQNPRELTRD
jgi:leader peptidase (prepilin peptidase)/N-methyltransferase